MTVDVHTPRADAPTPTREDASLVPGGPIYNLLVRLGLVKPPLDRVGLRILVIWLVAWAPLFILATLDGRLAGGVAIPFLSDFEVHLRFLAALPLIIGAELSVHRGMAMLLRQFVDQQIVGPSVLPRYEQCIRSAVRLRNSTVAEVVLLGVVVLGGSFWWKSVVALQSDTWYAATLGGRHTLTPAGYWYQFVSLPIVEFLLLSWQFRLLVWTRLLWQISRLDLTLVPTHPDARCGLGFLEIMALSLGPFLMAHTVILSGFLANRIVHEGGRLPDYTLEIMAMVIVLGILAVGPLCVFVPRLIRQRIQGLHVYGAFAGEYIIAFERKWIRGERPAGETPLGTPDLQSLADLANSFSVVQRVRPFPFGWEALEVLAIAVVVPLLPLALTMFSLRELVDRLLQVFL